MNDGQDRFRGWSRDLLGWSLSVLIAAGLCSCDKGAKKPDEKPCDKKRRERNSAIRKAHFVPGVRKKKSRR